MSAYGKLYLNDLVYLFNSVFIVLLKHTQTEIILSLIPILHSASFELQSYSQAQGVPFVFIIRTQIHSVRKLISNLAPNGLELTLHTPHFRIPSAIDIDGLYGYSRICWHATSGKRRNNKNNHIQMRTNKRELLPPPSPSSPHTGWQFAPIAHHPSDVLIWKIQSDYNLNALSSERANERVFKATMSTQQKWFEQFCLSKGINAIN